MQPARTKKCTNLGYTRYLRSSLWASESTDDTHPHSMTADPSTKALDNVAQPPPHSHEASPLLSLPRQWRYHLRYQRFDQQVKIWSSSSIRKIPSMLHPQKRDRCLVLPSRRRSQVNLTPLKSPSPAHPIPSHPTPTPLWHLGRRSCISVSTSLKMRKFFATPSDDQQDIAPLSHTPRKHQHSLIKLVVHFYKDGLKHFEGTPRICHHPFPWK
jgi:hypothetical protein